MDDREVYEAWYREQLARCCEESANTPGFVQDFNRLTGCHFSPASTPDSSDSQQFIMFVDKYIWSAVADAMWKALEAESNQCRSREDSEVWMKKPAKHTSPDWTEMYRLELGIDPSDRHQLLNAVTKDIAVAHHGDQAAKRRVAAYDRAQRSFERQIADEEREAAENDEDDAADEN
jgi:hypothetical protein